VDADLGDHAGPFDSFAARRAWRFDEAPDSTSMTADHDLVLDPDRPLGMRL
jgi:hypothetical protein